MRLPSELPSRSTSAELPGDILVFLTGEDEIERASEAIAAKASQLESECGPCAVLPLFGSMPIDQQQKVFERCLGVRKVIVSTNIAETSVTIDGIVYVVDCGFAKQKLYHPRFKFDSLKIAPISQASAVQRAGRAGRTAPGKCFRLYTEQSYGPFAAGLRTGDQTQRVVQHDTVAEHPRLWPADHLRAS